MKNNNYFIQNVPKSHFVHQGFAKSINANIFSPTPKNTPFILIPFYSFFKILFKINKIPKTGNYLCEGFAGLYFARFLKMFKPKIKIIYHDADAFFYLTYPKLKGIKKKYLDFYLKKIDYAISDSEISKKYLTKYISLEKEVPVVYPFVKTTKFGFKPSLDSKTIIYVGRLSNEKNLPNLIKAFSLVKKEINDTKLIMVGDGPQKQELKNLCDKLNLNNVIFTGWLTDFNKYLNQSLIGYNVSLFEPFGCNGLEYALSGVIPLLGDKNGNAEVLNNERIICSPDDHQEIANRIIKLINLKKEEKEKLLNDLSKISLEYNEKNQCDKFKSAFEELVE